jgi:uncharacterized integral membrane protein
VNTLRRWASRLALGLIVGLALLFGMFNGRLVELDFVFAVWQLPLGVALLAFLFLGVLIGGVTVWLDQKLHPGRRPGV